MIYERTASPSSTRTQGPLFAKALEYFAAHDIDSLAVGRTDIQGDDLYVLRNEYETRPIEKGAWEAHRKYADIQIMVRGEERMGIGDPLSTLTTKRAYDAEGDVEILTGPGQFLHMKPGDIFVFFPHDPHMPGVALESGPGKVSKMVFKVRLG